MKKILTLITILYLFSLNLYSQSTLSVGNGSGFIDFRLNNLEISKGERDKDQLEIKQNEYEPNQETDLLVHFNDKSFSDSANNYVVNQHYANVSDIEKKVGNASAYFFKDRGITFSSNGESMFSPGRILGDFTIEFWIYPSKISEHSTVFSWKGVNKVDERFIAQKIKCNFEGRQVVWNFENFFTPDDFSEYTLKLTGKSKLIPNKWSHHLIRYNSHTGLLEYLLNGIPEDIKFSTLSKNEESTIFSPYIGSFSKSEIFIGEDFRGFVDELRISESFIEQPELSKYKKSGSFESPVIDINGEEIILENITFLDAQQVETTIIYDYRISSIPFLGDNDIIEWSSIDSITPSTTGRYLQIRGDFFSNGNKTVSPSLQNINILWDKIPKPPAPILITATPEKNSIKLQWAPVKHYQIDGYYIYFGSESNKYQEIVDVGKNTNYTIDNLISKNIYYFSLKAYNNKGYKSNFSKEIFCRPE